MNDEALAVLKSLQSQMTDLVSAIEGGHPGLESALADIVHALEGAGVGKALQALAKALGTPPVVNLPAIELCPVFQVPQAPAAPAPIVQFLPHDEGEQTWDVTVQGQFGAPDRRMTIVKRARKG
jgi:hypothetical protein